MGGEVIIVSDENFHREIGNSEIPFLINFWSFWWSPCKTVTPPVEELAQEISGEQMGKNVMGILVGLLDPAVTQWRSV